MALKNSSPFVLEFQSSNEAWYSVYLVLQGETLTLKYYDFSDAHDERYIAADYKDPNKMESFIAKFRPTSVQLQDYECRKVIEGQSVCASFKFAEDDVRLYDAIVEEVDYKDHKYRKEDTCTCTFVLFWLFGQNEGQTAQATIGQICLLQSGNPLMDQTLSSFVEICRKKNKMATQYSGCASEVDNDDEPRSPQFESYTHLPKEVKSYRHSVSTDWKCEERITDHCEKSEQDMDLGGKFDFLEDLKETSSSHYVLIENLDKDTSPSAIMNFVRKYVGVTCQAQVFPSLSSESYTRGIILVDNQEELQKLSIFLRNPAHMTLSSGGRPWVITDKIFLPVAVGTEIGKLTMLPESRPWDKSLEVCEKIRIVRSGTEEYERGKLWLDLFLGFADHQRGLHQKLALAESKILQASNVPGRSL